MAAVLEPNQFWIMAYGRGGLESLSASYELSKLSSHVIALGCSVTTAEISDSEPGDRP